MAQLECHNVKYLGNEKPAKTCLVIILAPLICYANDYFTMLYSILYYEVYTSHIAAGYVYIIIDKYCARFENNHVVVFGISNINWCDLLKIST